MRLVDEQLASLKDMMHLFASLRIISVFVCVCVEHWSFGLGSGNISIFGCIGLAWHGRKGFIGLPHQQSFSIFYFVIQNSWAQRCARSGFDRTHRPIRSCKRRRLQPFEHHSTTRFIQQLPPALATCISMLHDATGRQTAPHAHACCLCRMMVYSDTSLAISSVPLITLRLETRSRLSLLSFPIFPIPSHYISFRLAAGSAIMFAFLTTLSS